MDQCRRVWGIKSGDWGDSNRNCLKQFGYNRWFRRFFHRETIGIYPDWQGNQRALPDASCCWGGFWIPGSEAGGGNDIFGIMFHPRWGTERVSEQLFRLFEPTLLNEGVEFPGIPKVIAEENQEIEPDERIKDIKQAGQVENDEQPEQVEQIVEQEFVEQSNRLNRKYLMELRKQRGPN